MAKPAFLFFLSFCFLLLSGSSHLHLSVRSHIFSSLSANHTEEKGKEKTAIQSNQLAFHQPATNGAENDELNGIEPEEDDDHTESSRKYLELTSYYLHLYPAQLLGDVHLYNKADLPCCLHLAFTADAMHILHRVIRV